MRKLVKASTFKNSVLLNNTSSFSVCSCLLKSNISNSSLKINKNLSFKSSSSSTIQTRFFSTSYLSRKNNNSDDNEDDNNDETNRRKSVMKHFNDNDIIEDEDMGEEFIEQGEDDEALLASSDFNEKEVISPIAEHHTTTNNTNDNNNTLVPPQPSKDYSLKSFFSTPTPPIVEVVPLYKKPAFPGTIIPIFVSDLKFIQSLMESGLHDKLVGLFLVKDVEGQRDEQKNITSVDDIEKVGTLAKVTRVVPARGGASVILAAIRRIKVVEQVSTDANKDGNKDSKAEGSSTAKTTISGTTMKGSNMGRLHVKIEELPTKKMDKDSTEVKAYVMEVLQQIKELSNLDPVQKDQLTMILEQLDYTDPSELADIATILSTIEPEKLQEILATVDVRERLIKSLELLKKEVETKKIQQKIQKNLEDKLNKQQRKLYLQEQLKIIKQELGLEKDGKEELVKRFTSQIADIKKRGGVPEQVLNTMDDELNKFSTLDPHSGEYSNVRNYLEWITCLPWNKYSKENFDLNIAEKVLDRDHYGLKKLKERILEFIAVGKLKNSVKGKIICFVGPPGVGKTSIGKSIAAALNREFYRFSVGGLSDVSEIKGHRRTYIGAIPGKLINILKLAKSSNPVIMIDEIDKLGRSYQGDPASALLEVLDPEQNSNFVDHYLDVPYDLSQVLFICTANMLDTIPGPLLDRMEVLRLSGYVLDEKLHITKNYLLPKKLEETGLLQSNDTSSNNSTNTTNNATNNNNATKKSRKTTKPKPKQSLLTLDDSLIEKLIREHCREAGVRNLEKHVELICRKVAYKIAKQNNKKPKPFHLTDKDLEEYVGKPVFTSDRYYLTTPPGVTMGLAWTSMGGSTLYIETTAEKVGNTQVDQPESSHSAQIQAHLRCTGSMGDVMKESSSIAYTYAKNHLYSIDPKNDYFRKTNIHMHVPEGATPKDGPSAGVTMVTSLLSLALNKPVKHNLAMTGELTLTGKVLTIGGVKEKVIAARRSGIKDVILPIGNRRDWDELDSGIKLGLNVHFADYYDDVYKIAFEYNEELNRKAIEEDRKQPNLMDLEK
ncbi:hypothetical protein ABK040_011286 [Willaertia magna]